MAHDTHHDDGFHEIQLSGKQLVFLFMATTVVSIVIFLFGVLVGRGAPLERSVVSGDPDAPLTAPVDELAAAPRSGRPTPEAGLTYPERLADASVPGERVAPPARAGATAAVPSPTPTPAPAPPEPAPAAAPASTTPPPAPAGAVAESTQPAGAPSAAGPAPVGDGGFTVQVTALKSKADADAMAERLQSKGYPAYVVAPDAGGQVIYKVRVGMNMGRPEADQLMRRLQTEEKFKPWVTR
jgi:cell division septation protein DedD